MGVVLEEERPGSGEWGMGGVGEGAPDECSEIIPRARHRAGSFE